MRALAIVLALVPGVASANGLNCTFTTICSPATDCQAHPGVPFTFNLISGALSIATENGLVFGTPLSHLDAPAFGVMFAMAPSSTIILSITGEGEAVMTQQDIATTGIQSVSYFGTCEPGA